MDVHRRRRLYGQGIIIIIKSKFSFIKFKVWDLRINQLNCQRIFQVISILYKNMPLIFKVNTPIYAVALHPNQVELFIADSTGAIYLWDLRSDRDDSLITEVDISEFVCNFVKY